VYHFIVRRNLRNSFDQVNRGEFAPIVRQFTPSGTEHWFSGSHALSGGRRDIEQIQEWYDRLAALFPDLRFEIKKVAAKGWPWNTIAFVEWVDHLTDRAGNHYSNQGVHVLRIKWGKIVELHIYCDTQVLAAVCQILGSQGVEQAVAAPIGKPNPAVAAIHGNRK
jgi:ketosteroid isomerase-like protein